MARLGYREIHQCPPVIGRRFGRVCLSQPNWRSRKTPYGLSTGPFVTSLNVPGAPTLSATVKIMDLPSRSIVALLEPVRKLSPAYEVNPQYSPNPMSRLNAYVCPISHCALGGYRPMVGKTALGSPRPGNARQHLLLGANLAFIV
ncbi:hypothetical protein PCH_Pc16g09850 [Penicillium rubens Wisconsin 54-1255]|uniref:Uncharacterized protein n=1 Tax=Penicillium rubens (strain ATCC 28089 / DSM 1075 / NRRL 1951 / Wisconsin 54-1255) TaxID=500485 RepID=B6H8W4_PENRW|nr:hypothetical protein PCH_Pc16g09850 [Penicillium rubens Wisconsin 54-1255]